MATKAPLAYEATLGIPKVVTSPDTLDRGVINGAVYIQPAAPTGTPVTYLWVQTGLGAGTDFTIWFEGGP